MRYILLSIPLLALTACETPQEACISNVAREINTLSALAARTRGNIERGFAVETRQETREVNTTCRGRTESGEVVRVRCEEVRVRDVHVPITIDVASERIKLAQLEERIAMLQGQAQADIAQCRMRFPEG